MAAIERDAVIIEQAFCERARFCVAPEEFRTLMAFDREHGQYLMIDEWSEGYRRIHRGWAHIELQYNKIWIHEDGTEEGIANLLLAAGIPRDGIVLAFHAPSLQADTEFTVV